jgi:SsrA-binding protein
MTVLAYNKRANFDYEISDVYEAGIVLYGHEVKSVKTGHISLKGSFVVMKSQGGNKLPEAHLVNAHIPIYKYAASQVKDYDPTRPRKLLLKKKEISYLVGKKHEQGLTLVPIKLYTKHSLLKVQFGVGKGKKKIDKRETIKKRELDRSLRTLTKRKQL